MKIKLAILEKDENYLERLVAAFNVRYADKFEIYSFTDKEVALATISSVKIDVLVVDEIYDIDLDAIPKRCGFAYFVDSPGIDTYKEQHAICKFQKAELIYKQILSIYSENAGNVAGLKIDDHSTKIIAFSSPSGGVGASSMAAACALHFTQKNKKVLYLNVEKFGVSDVFFSAEGTSDMSDVIFALKSKKANLAIKLESCVKCDETGVYFFSQAKHALDMLELTPDDIMRLITELKISGSYDFIILDIDFSMNKEILNILRKCHAIIIVGDGSEISNVKIYKALEALNTKEQNKEVPIVQKSFLVYNKFSNKTCKVIDNLGIKNIGGAPRYEHATTKQVINQLAQLDVYGKVL